jgi:flagellar biosynthesis/type III secretory pathway chaperone
MSSPLSRSVPEPGDADRLIAAAMDCCARLTEVLEQERHALQRHDLAALEEAVRRKQALLADFGALERRRRLLPHGADGTLDHDGGLRAALHRCRELNACIGALVQARLRQTQLCLAVLRGQTPGTETYGPSGICDPTSPVPRTAVKA